MCQPWGVAPLAGSVDRNYAILNYTETGNPRRSPRGERG